MAFGLETLESEAATRETANHRPCKPWPTCAIVGHGSGSELERRTRALRISGPKAMNSIHYMAPRSWHGCC